MKKGFFTSVAIIVAFLAGMSVYVACGNSDNGANATIADLQAEIRLIKNELEVLKASCGEFEVDGLYFNRAGEVISKPFKKQDDVDFTKTYHYDEHGRLLKTVFEDSGGIWHEEYSYSGKKVTIVASHGSSESMEYY